MANTLKSIFVSLLLAGCSAFGIRQSEEPHYTLVFEQGAMQIRHYSTMVVAETEIAADYEASGSIGFKRLAGYIFGNNSQRQEMAMTAPVYRKPASETLDMAAPVFRQHSDNRWHMAFVMPSGRALADLPQPLDPLVRLREVPGKKVAVIRFSGALTLANAEKQSQALLAWLNANHYRPASEPRIAAYDPPWTLPWLRRNEIHIDIE